MYFLIWLEGAKTPTEERYATRLNEDYKINCQVGFEKVLVEGTTQHWMEMGLNNPQRDHWYKTKFIEEAFITENRSLVCIVTT